MDSAGISFSTLFNESPPHSGKGTEYNKIKAQDEADLQAKRSVFEDHFKPPTGRKRHSRTAVLLLYWEKNDINVGTEVSQVRFPIQPSEAQWFRANTTAPLECLPL